MLGPVHHRTLFPYIVRHLEVLSRLIWQALIEVDLAKGVQIRHRASRGLPAYEVLLCLGLLLFWLVRCEGNLTYRKLKLIFSSLGALLLGSFSKCVPVLDHESLIESLMENQSMLLFLLRRVLEKWTRLRKDSELIVIRILKYFAFGRADQWAIQEVEWRLLSGRDVLQCRRPLLILILVDRHHPELLFGLSNQFRREHFARLLLLLLRLVSFSDILRRVFLRVRLIGSVFLGARSLVDLVLFLGA